jgi:hypothetical protein
MIWDPNAPLDEQVLHAARTFRTQLPTCGPGRYFDHVPLHWTAEAYKCADPTSAYNALVRLSDDGKSWILLVDHNPLDNAIQVSDAAPYAAHTYLRNSHGFGIAVNAWADPAQPLQLHALDYLCGGAAAICNKYNLQAASQKVVYTHAECAVWDNYPDERIDLARLGPLSAGPITVSERFATGDLIRQRVHFIKVGLDKEFEVGS